MFEGGYSYGPRYLVPGIALLCLALGAALEAATPFLKKLAIGLFAAGVLVNAIGLATSFLEAQVGFYYDRFYNYQIDYSPHHAPDQSLLPISNRSGTRANRPGLRSLVDYFVESRNLLRHSLDHRLNRNRRPRDSNLVSVLRPEKIPPASCVAFQGRHPESYPIRVAEGRISVLRFGCHSESRFSG